MDISIEQVEKLKEYAHVTYEEAKEALKQADGDLLEAVIILEKEGKTKERTAEYSSEETVAEDYHDEKSQDDDRSYEKNTSSFGEQMNRLWNAFLKLLHKGSINQFEAHKNGRVILAVPVVVLILALLFFFWITLPLLIIFLFMGYKYRFSGPVLGKDGINDVMDSASDAAENLQKSKDDE